MFASRTIEIANLPSHTHSFSATTSSNGSHTHTIAFNLSTGGGENGSNAGSVSQNPGTETTSADGAHTHTVSGTTGGTGSGTALDFAVQFCNVIKASKDAY